MSVSGRDLVFLKIHYRLLRSRNKENLLMYHDIPEDKQWIIHHLSKVERKIAIFYFLMFPCFSHVKSYRFYLRTYFTDFTGYRTYPKYFDITLDKIEYYCNIMEQAKANLDFERLAELNCGEIVGKFTPSESILCNPISYNDVILKYPESLEKLVKKLRKSKSKYKNDSLDSFNWFVSTKNSVPTLVCKKSTKLTIIECI